MRDLSKKSNEQRSVLMGRVVDSYTNILTVKLFSRMNDEDAYVRDAINDHAAAIAAHMRLVTKFSTTLSALNALLLVRRPPLVFSFGLAVILRREQWPWRCLSPGPSLTRADG